MSIDPKRTGKINRRSDILRAAERLMRSHGLSGVTTRQISKEVGCSEGAYTFISKGASNCFSRCWRRAFRVC